MSGFVPRHKTEVYAVCVFVQHPDVIVEDIRKSIQELLRGRTTGSFVITISDPEDA